MKPCYFLASLVALAAAVPTNLALRAESCPTIAQIAETGQLPPGTLSPAFLQTVSQKKPNKAFPAGQSAIVTPDDMCTITKFDIPASAQNKTCSLVLTLGPCGGAYEKGPGNIIFQGLTGVSFPVAGNTTFANQPPVAPPFHDSPVITLGNAYRLGGGPCDYKPGQEFASVGGRICSTDTTLKFTEAYGGNGKCPIGFHIIIT